MSEPLFKVEKGVQIPARAMYRKYPLSQMVAGDSFFVPDAKRHLVYSAVSYHAKRSGGMFTCRTVDGGVRVWRIE